MEPHPAPEPSDLQLLDRVRDGDADAFDTIFRQWYAPLVRFADRIVRDRAAAEDIAQDALLALWQRRGSLPSGMVPQAWLFHVTRNRALNVVRRVDVVARGEAVLALSLTLDDQHQSDAEQALFEAELHAAIDAAVAALPPRCREVFLLSREQGMRQTDIAARLGVSLKAVEAHITKALRHLRSALAPWLERRNEF